MFFNSKVNYKTKIVVPTYPAVSVILEWKKDVPDTTGLNATVVKYIQPKWKFMEVKRDFQKEINSQYCITPKMIATTNTTVPNPQPVQYQKVPLNDLNATDIRLGTKEIVNSYIKKQSESYANNVVDHIKDSDKDLRIKQLQNEIDNLKKGVK